MTKPSLPQGTRDFGPEVVRKRNYIFSCIKNVFELYGFQPLETPAFENLDTLIGKYGAEGDKLIFKILNNGLDNVEKQVQIKEDFEKLLQGKNSKGLTERALRYDLTIPFARYVATNHSQMLFPFKRYQIQPVWRADRPQKGRYREFYQCDVDVVGSNSLLNEIEFCCIYHDVFSQLGIKEYTVTINHRKILIALATICGDADKMSIIASSIDKLEKIGLEKVKEELQTRGFNKKQLDLIEKYLLISGTNEEKLISLTELIGETETGNKGIEEIRKVISEKPKGQNIQLDVTLARGLNYYTGIIFEAKAPEQVKIGSVSGGGRYDDLTGLFGVPNIPGVGISFGVDRIYDVMEELNLFPTTVHSGTQVLFFNLGEKESSCAFQLMQELRHKNISCELFHESVKFDKQFKYAEKKNIPYVVIIGSKELEDKTCTIKNLQKGSQENLLQHEIVTYPF